MMIDLNLNDVLDGAVAASNSVDPDAVREVVQEHDFRTTTIPNSYPLPPPPAVAMPQEQGLFSKADLPNVAFQSREAELRRYYEQLSKHEAQRGCAFGMAREREKSAEVQREMQRKADARVRDAELQRERARLEAHYAVAQPPTTMAGVAGQAMTSWVPMMFYDPLFRMFLTFALVGGIGYVAWSLGQRLLPKELRGGS